MNKFSGLVMTLNEEKNIQDCLSSLFLVCDDVVVVDSNSQDKTVEIAEKMGATVLLQNFLGDGPQRSFGARHCKHDWVIYLDADERLDQDLVNELPGLDLDNASIEAYECRRKNHIHGRWIKVAGQYPDYICRIFNKSKTDFSPDQIHARIETKKLSKTSGHILHNSFENLNDMIRRMNLYSDWHSEDLFNRHKRVSGLAPITHGMISFFKFYIFRRGFMAGLDGLSLSITNSLGSYFKYAKLIEKNKSNKKE
jgi:glycosyltransferase involved in cell wall biosynthesis